MATELSARERAVPQHQTPQVLVASEPQAESMQAKARVIKFGCSS